MTSVKKEGTALIAVDVQNYVLHENRFGADWGSLSMQKRKI
ncbi:hypothetical protein [Methanosarcina acetivorans]|nr:hypothetical protein [Methanosarcina acetivorans]